MRVRVIKSDELHMVCSICGQNIMLVSGEETTTVSDGTAVHVECKKYIESLRGDV
jgi:hypothetical protein